MALLNYKYQICIKKFKKFVKKFDKNVLFSIGENCLADDILARNNLKSFSSPYSFGRSNIEYLLLFENEQFADFLNMDYLSYESLSNHDVARNKKYVDVKNQYHDSCSKGFEFTHHDVIGFEKHRKTIRKRCQRLSTLKNKNIIMLYHHRYCQETDKKLLISHLKKLAEPYKSRNNKVNIFLFYQVLVPHETQRKVEKFVDGDISVYTFYTLNVWEGDDPNLLWARCDNDLLEEMIIDIRKKLC